MSLPSLRQRDRMSAYLNGLGVVRQNGTCHSLAYHCGRWNAIFICDDGHIRSFGLSDDPKMRQHQIKSGAASLRSRMARGGIEVTHVFTIRWHKEPEHV